MSSNLTNRVARLERQAVAETGVSHVLRYVVSAAPGEPATSSLWEVQRLGGRHGPGQRFKREDGETEAAFRKRAGLGENETTANLPETRSANLAERF